MILLCIYLIYLLQKATEYLDLFGNESGILSSIRHVQGLSDRVFAVTKSLKPVILRRKIIQVWATAVRPEQVSKLLNRGRTSIAASRRSLTHRLAFVHRLPANGILPPVCYHRGMSLPRCRKAERVRRKPSTVRGNAP